MKCFSLSLPSCYMYVPKWIAWFKHESSNLICTLVITRGYNRKSSVKFSQPEVPLCSMDFSCFRLSRKQNIRFSFNFVCTRKEPLDGRRGLLWDNDIWTKYLSILVLTFLWGLDFRGFQGKGLKFPYKVLIHCILWFYRVCNINEN